MESTVKCVWMNHLRRFNPHYPAQLEGIVSREEWDEALTKLNHGVSYTHSVAWTIMAWLAGLAFPCLLIAVILGSLVAFEISGATTRRVVHPNQHHPTIPTSSSEYVVVNLFAIWGLVVNIMPIFTILVVWLVTTIQFDLLYRICNKSRISRQLQATVDELNEQFNGRGGLTWRAFYSARSYQFFIEISVSSDAQPKVLHSSHVVRLPINKTSWKFTMPFSGSLPEGLPPTTLQNAVGHVTTHLKTPIWMHICLAAVVIFNLLLLIIPASMQESARSLPQLVEAGLLVLLFGTGCCTASIVVLYLRHMFTKELRLMAAVNDLNDDDDYRIEGGGWYISHTPLDLVADSEDRPAGRHNWFLDVYVPRQGPTGYTTNEGGYGSYGSGNGSGNYKPSSSSSTRKSKPITPSNEKAPLLP